MKFIFAAAQCPILVCIFARHGVSLYTSKLCVAYVLYPAVSQSGETRRSTSKSQEAS